MSRWTPITYVIVNIGEDATRLYEVTVSIFVIKAEMKGQHIFQMSTQHLVQYVVVRTDLLTVLAWPVGAVIAQACHATAAVTHLFQNDENTVKYLANLDNMHKVVLGIDGEPKLRTLAEKLKEGSVDHKLWIEQPEDIPTCLVTKPYPKEEIQKFFKKLKLFKAEPSSVIDVGKSN
ncbi:putative peptidyl-tRNA hydrolase PTRHD1 isoform X2 [Oratosquilla oratoria]|uniref:putative peptidyl-tRNA hydrolase PTRHD1 isoform X2 n=1 Tax=Oratosquilla oratoria TaxID=337810 RepID=UPI003F75BF14